ncbi:hypothetical protein U91I_04106 [alpha proteobacterium U9-1i]|nr:hypothetical protein U91I_04106 [alpha proteobacterium U9-1i]
MQLSSPVYGGGVPDTVRDGGGAARAAQNRFKRSVQVLVDVIVRHANDPPAFAAQNLISNLVVLQLFLRCVRSAVHLNNQTGFDAYKVGDIRLDGVLSSEF